GWFIFDSGARNQLHLDRRDRGETWPDRSARSARAASVAPVKAHFWRADSLSLGPMRVTTPLFMELELAFLEQYFGVPVAGILGFGVSLALRGRARY
ncbi:MAG: hypothetical protein IPK72_17500, partial [Candidatus Eisenbacteria bacterium]|nr:hypothetical protein [Candidatus Eisenbacteria bacterium]